MSTQPSLYTVGRSFENDIVVDHNSVSKEHAEFFHDPEGNVFLIDLKSERGTFVNGKRIIDPLLLNEGDDVSFGDEQHVDWEYLILKKAKKKPNDALKPQTKSSGLVKDNLDLIIIFGAIVIILFILSFMFG